VLQKAFCKSNIKVPSKRPLAAPERGRVRDEREREREREKERQREAPDIKLQAPRIPIALAYFLFYLKIFKY
jgi:hypothetical protein